MICLKPIFAKPLNSLKWWINPIFSQPILRNFSFRWQKLKKVVNNLVTPCTKPPPSIWNCVLILVTSFCCYATSRRKKQFWFILMLNTVSAKICWKQWNHKLHSSQIVTGLTKGCKWRGVVCIYIWIPKLQYEFKYFVRGRVGGSYFVKYLIRTGTTR